jgi:hypothetical protein
MRGLVDDNKTLYSDDLETIGEYHQGSWFFDHNPEVQLEDRPSQGDLLVAYIEGAAAGMVAICRMDMVSAGKFLRSQRLQNRSGEKPRSR